MIIVFGRRIYGRVEVSGPSFVYTEFAHLWYMPLIPLGSYVVLGRDERGLLRAVPLRLHGMSVLAGYTRAWTTAAAAACLLGAILGIAEGNASGLLFLVLAIGLASVALIAWRKLGKLSPAELERRRTYARFAGSPVDVGQLGVHGERLAGSLRAGIAAQAKSLMSGTYRSALDPSTQWAEIALDPTVVDRGFVEACFTLSRIEWAAAKGADRARLHATHRQLAGKLASLGSGATASPSNALPPEPAGGAQTSGGAQT